MDWYEGDVRWVEACVRANPPAADAVAFYGSSSVRLWGTLADDFPDLPVVNLGFGGSTLAACVHFFDRLVRPVAPRALLVYAGDNDLGDGRGPEQVFESFRHLRGRVLALPTPPRFAFLAVKHSPARWHLRGHVDRVNGLVRAALGDWPGARFVDVSTPLLGPDGTPDPALFADDGLHLSPAGYRVWADVLRRQDGVFS